VVAVGEGQVGDKGLENLYTIDLTSPAWTAKPLVEGFDAGYVYAGADSGRLYFATTLEAPRGRVIAFDPASRERAHWKEVIPQGSDAIDMTSTNVTLVGHQLLVSTVHDAHSRVAVYGLDGRLRREVKLPGAGTAKGFEGYPEDRETFFQFTDAVTPPTIYATTSPPARPRSTPASRLRPAQPDRQVFYPAKETQDSDDAGLQEGPRARRHPSDAALRLWRVRDLLVAIVQLAPHRMAGDGRHLRCGQPARRR
jgi:hypothetical protein